MRGVAQGQSLGKTGIEKPPGDRGAGIIHGGTHGCAVPRVNSMKNLPGYRSRDEWPGPQLRPLSGLGYRALAGGTIPFMRRYSTICP